MSRYVMCFSLILLSVDLSSPHVKNKMSKREFIRNTRGAVGAEGDNRSLVGVVMLKNATVSEIQQLVGGLS